MAKKEFQYLIDAALEQGWRVQHLKSGHIKLLPPDRSKPAVVMGGTVSDHRGLMNARSQLRKSGLVLPENVSGLGCGCSGLGSVEQKMVPQFIVGPGDIQAFNEHWEMEDVAFPARVLCRRASSTATRVVTPAGAPTSTSW